MAPQGGGREDGALLRDDGSRTRRLPAAADRWARQDRPGGHPPLGGGARTPECGEEAGDGGVPGRGEDDGVRLRADSEEEVRQMLDDMPLSRVAKPNIRRMQALGEMHAVDQF